jgi:hypothetical protein
MPSTSTAASRWSRPASPADQPLPTVGTRATGPPPFNPTGRSQPSQSIGGDLSDDGPLLLACTGPNFLRAPRSLMGIG